VDEKVFDVSKPHKVLPDASGKPIIVGHHPEMVDPMVRDHVPPKPITVNDAETKAESEPIDGPLSAEDSPKTEIGTPAPSAGETISPDGFGENTKDSPPPAPLDLPAEPPAVQLPADQAPAETELPIKPEQPAPKNQDWHPDSQLPIPAPGGAHHVSIKRKRTPLIVLAAVAALLAIYALLDSGLVGNVNLPLHIFKQESAPPPETATEQSATAQTSTSSSPPSTGLAAYSVKNTDISFSYPASWGVPIETAEPGYTKRGGNNQSNGTYAYLVNFATNKDVQIAITSGQYLPIARGSSYYDYQKWCTGSADGKIYKELLRFSSTAGVDTPTTTTCDQGPLSDSTKLDDAVVVQVKTTNPDGSSLGDLYTQNLDSNDFPAIRVKDASSANSENIKKLLASIKA